VPSTALAKEGNAEEAEMEEEKTSFSTASEVKSSLTCWFLRRYQI
jgi:hypothetical protein